MMMSWISASDSALISVDLGIQRRYRPLAFSMPPFCHEA
jgi:hypothetical protein